MTMRIAWIAALAIICPAASAESAPYGHPDFYPSPERPVGWRGDGSGRFPGATPPLEWADGTVLSDAPIAVARKVTRKKHAKKMKVTRRDPAKEHGIRWKTCMPNWSNASPIVVGDRVFVMSEPTDIAPLLIGLDAKTGRILWRSEVDHLKEIPDSDDARRRWSEYHKLRRRLFRLAAEQWLRDAGEEVPGWTERAAALGIDELKGSRVLGGWQSDFSGPGVAALAARIDGRESGGQRTRLDKFNCVTLPWESQLVTDKTGLKTKGNVYVGYTHGTPVCDGERVYVFTGHNCAAAFDLDGKEQWTTWLGQWTNCSRSGIDVGWMDFTQSPVLVDGRLLVANNQYLTCLDAGDGEVLWRREVDPANANGELTPRCSQCLLTTGVALRLEGGAYFLWYDGLVYRVADGEPVSERIYGRDAFYIGGCPIVEGNVVVYPSFLSKEKRKKKWMGALAAVELQVKGDRVVHRKLWRHELAGQATHNGVCHDGRLYVPMHGVAHKPLPAETIRDLVTGEVVGEGPFIADHVTGLVQGGDHLFTLESDPKSGNSGFAEFHVYDLAGKEVAVNLLSGPRNEERMALIRSESGTEFWSDYRSVGHCYATPFFLGDCIYVRTRDEVICIGK